MEGSSSKIHPADVTSEINETQVKVDQEAKSDVLFAESVKKVRNESDLNVEASKKIMELLPEFTKSKWKKHRSLQLQPHIEM